MGGGCKSSSNAALLVFAGCWAGCPVGVCLVSQGLTQTGTLGSRAPLFRRGKGLTLIPWLVGWIRIQSPGFSYLTSSPPDGEAAWQQKLHASLLHTRSEIALTVSLI